RDEPGLAGLFAELRSARSSLARHSARPPEPEERSSWLRRAIELEQRKERLEADLARASETFRERRTIDSSAVPRPLPRGAAFVEFLESSHPLPDRGPRSERRLLAFISRADRAVLLVPLGASAPIEESITAWRKPCEAQPPEPLDGPAA